MTLDAPRILDLLPSIHATILSIYGAAIPAFYFYTYEKVRKARDDFTQTIIKHIPVFSGLIEMPSDKDIFTADGKIDWGEKAYIYMFESIDFDHKPGVNDDELCEQVESFLNFLDGLLSYPPSFGINYSQAPVPAGDIILTSDDIKEINEKLRLMHYRLFEFSNNFVDLCYKADTYKTEKETKNIDAFIARSTPHESLMKNPEIKKIVEQQNQNLYKHHSHGNYYSQRLNNFKNRCETILDKSIPELLSSCNEYEKWKDLFSIKTKIKSSLKTLAAGLIMGVIAPLFISLTFKGRLDFNSWPMITTEYVLLVIPFVLYLYIIRTYYIEANSSKVI